MICFLCVLGIVNKSDAASASLSVWADDDLGSGGSTQAWLTADEGIDFIDWYINDDPNDPDSDYEYEKTTRYNGATTAYEYLGNFTGNIKGTKYGVRAVVSFEESSDEDVTDTFRVFAPKTISGTKYPQGIADGKRGDGIYGEVKLYRHYHDGQNIVVDGSVYARNRTKVDYRASSFYRHTEFDAIGETVWLQEDPHTSESLPKEGGTYSSYGSSMINYWVGGDIGPDQTIKLNAHVHLEAGGVVWHENNNMWTHEFTEDDNQ